MNHPFVITGGADRGAAAPFAEEPDGLPPACFFAVLPRFQSDKLVLTNFFIGPENISGCFQVIDRNETINHASWRELGEEEEGTEKKD
ncbi:hypothetical protein [Akkermansia sp.]|uniref:hypothetical protein n=1 Tax=Akkermansia sp. TaxID=1872421 RepID=UPI0025C174F2|nr:hypothetical protein [Akkermansia sp.]